jgi:hypothetical protein
MSDGSNMGITAGRALGTILGGEDQPTEDEKQTREQVYARIMSRPDPCEGEGIWDRSNIRSVDEPDEAYSIAADCIAKAFLLIEEEFPGTLETQLYYPEDFDYEPLRGKPQSPEMAIWNKTMEKWPKFDDWIGGASGFMVGFAYNTARWLNEKPIVNNPAIVTIGPKRP